MTLQLINVGLMLSNFFFWTITEWNKIDTKIRNFLYSVSIIQFSIFSIFCSKKLDYNLVPSPLSNIHNSSGIKLLTRLRLGLSHLNEHNHIFDDSINPFLHLQFGTWVNITPPFCTVIIIIYTLRSILFQDLKSLNKNLLKLSDKKLYSFNSSLMVVYNTVLWTINFSIKYNENFKYFSVSLI